MDSARAGSAVLERALESKVPTGGDAKAASGKARNESQREGTVKTHHRREADFFR